MKEKILSFFKRIRHTVLFVVISFKIWWVVFHSHCLRKLWKYRKIVSLWLAGYKWVTMDQFLDEFKPKSGHSKCNGKGYFVIKAADGFKRIMYCSCVHDQYIKSGKKYMMKDPTL